MADKNRRAGAFLRDAKVQKTLGLLLDPIAIAEDEYYAYISPE